MGNIKSIQIQLTSACNQKCIMCRKYTWPKREIPLDLVIEKIEKYKGATVTFSGGDPLAYTHLEGLVEYLTKNRTVYQIFTNLTYKFNNAIYNFLVHAECIQVSLDGHDDASYDKIRNSNGKFGILLLNALTLKLLNYSNVKFNCCVSKANINEMVKIAKLAHTLGYPVRFWPVHTHDNLKLSVDDIPNFMNELDQQIIDNTNLMDFESLINRKVPDACYVRNYHRVIDEEGNEYPCCRAINDNGEFIDSKNSMDNLDIRTVYQMYDFCKECDRYVKFNSNWDKYKDKENLFL